MSATVRYGQVQRSAMNWPFFVAHDLDLFAAQGLEVRYEIFTSPPEPVRALISGSLDLINVIPDVALVEMANGAPLRVIAGTNVGFQYRLMAKPEIQAIPALRARRIGVNDSRSAEALLLHKLLRRGGIEAGSYELVSAGPPPERCERLKEGAIDATMVTEPFHFVLEEAGFRMLGCSLDVAPDYPFTMCLVRYEHAISDALVRFVRALRAAWLWLRERANRDKAVAILSRCTATAPRHAELTYDLYFSRPSPPRLAPDPRGIAVLLDLLIESGKLSSRPDPERLIDRRYVQASME
ncbi:MAG TPA: ABC transporter substrate-binding protein [Candidatus Acidoferrales bacterium]|nr:ABC transporter substrate-binding protein [Candidatus Acidoferrales bacterium]